MSTPVEEFVSACFDELCLSKRFIPYVQRAEAAGYPQIAKLFRALVASEAAREGLFRKGIPHHAELNGNYYVCPHCGLVYDGELPKQCLVDETPGAAFILIE